jgi:hypothetical protein
MCSKKLITLLGSNPYQPWPVGPDVWPTDRNWHYDRLAGRPGSRQLLLDRLYHYARGRFELAEQAVVPS